MAIFDHHSHLGGGINDLSLIGALPSFCAILALGCAKRTRLGAESLPVFRFQVGGSVLCEGCPFWDGEFTENPTKMGSQNGFDNHSHVSRNARAEHRCPWLIWFKHGRFLVSLVQSTAGFHQLPGKPIDFPKKDTYGGHALFSDGFAGRPHGEPSVLEGTRLFMVLRGRQMGNHHCSGCASKKRWPFVAS